MNPEKPTLRHIIFKMKKDEDKERILKTAREKQLVIYKGALIKISQLISQKKLCQLEGTGKKYSKS